MKDYSLGKIYKIVCDTTGLTYYGSTCEPNLARRLAGHVGQKKRWIDGKINAKCTSILVLENNNYTIVLVELYPCDDSMKLHQRERFFIENNECVNKTIPTRTREEYLIINRSIILEKKSEYRILNKIQIAEYDVQYRLDNREKINKQRAKTRADNTGNAKIQEAIYREINKDKIKKRRADYRLNNREKILEYERLYRLKKKELQSTPPLGEIVE